jgi:hypothetical protein
MAMNFAPSAAFDASEPSWPSVTFVTAKEGGLSVDLALKLNVLALCAACVFVGAVLLGAF